MWLSARPIQRHVGRVMFGAVAIFGVANLVFALSHWFWLSMAALMLAGAADMVSVYIRSALVQFSTPDSMRGRVNAVNMLFIGSSNELGEFRAGTSAAWLGAVPAAVLGSLCTLGVVGGWMALFKPLRDRPAGGRGPRRPGLRQAPPAPTTVRHAARPRFWDAAGRAPHRGGSCSPSDRTAAFCARHAHRPRARWP